MTINFDKSRWDYIRDIYGKWWDGKLDRAIIPVVLKGNDPGRPEPKAPLLSQQTSLDLSISAADLIDRIDYELSKNVYLGDSFPCFNMDCFGPGVLAAFLGARPGNETGSIWFHCDEDKELKDMHFEYDPENVWFKRVKEIYAEACKRWNGQVLMGMVDLGGVLDVLATFRSTDKLLMDLYDEPEEVKRLVGELHELWIRYYNEINEVISIATPGYSDWSRIYSEKPSYVIQCDFSFMIGTEMFKEFAKDELIALTEKIPHTIYHLDGPGELRHLDELLSIKNLNAVQWVPGAGAPKQNEWSEVYQKISEAGKGIQVWDGFDCVDEIAKQIGTYAGIQHWDIIGDISQIDEFKKRLLSYGIETL